MVPRAAVVAVTLLAACARPPEALRGEYAPTTVAQAQADPPVGTRVRWGGTLVRAVPGDDGRTCLEVVSRPLDGAARPRPGDETSGRFVACTRGFYDPEVWAAGRDVTAVGAIAGVETATVGAREVREPLLDAEAVHLWPERGIEDGPRTGGWIGGAGGTGGGRGGVGVGIGIGF